jgi:hypothetical protein
MEILMTLLTVSIYSGVIFAATMADSGMAFYGKHLSNVRRQGIFFSPGRFAAERFGRRDD